MIRLALLVVVVIAMLLVLLYIASRLRNRHLDRKIKSIDDPVLALSRKERRAHAKKLLEREQEEYELFLQQQQNDVIKSLLTPPTDRNV